MRIYINQILEENKKVRKLYRNVEKKLKIQDKHIKFIIENMNDNLGVTNDGISEVLIILDEKLKENNNKLIAVLLHELGEADYISNKLPCIENNNHEEMLQMLTECFSHYHINKIINKYELKELMKPICECNREIKNYDSKIKNIVNLLHIKITYGLDDNYMNKYINFYDEYEECINNIILEMDKVSTIDCTEKDVRKIETKYNEVIRMIRDFSNYGEINLFSKLNNKVFFKNDNINIRVNINKHICKEILNNKENLEDIKVYIDTDTDTIIVEGLFDENFEVNDTYRYLINLEDKYPKFIYKNSTNYLINSEFNESSIKDDEKIESIVIILESPHMHEYSYKNKKLEVKGPAQNKTGQAIENNILMLINELLINYKCGLEKNEYRVILMNSIGYQTSLYSLHRKGLTSNNIYIEVRDRIWSELWDKKYIKESLKNRLAQCNVKLVINACTQVGSDKINNFLDKEGYKNRIKTSHPYNWGGFNIELV